MWLRGKWQSLAVPENLPEEEEEEEKLTGRGVSSRHVGYRGGVAELQPPERIRRTGMVRRLH